MKMVTDIDSTGVLYYKDGRTFKGTLSRGQFDGPGEMTVKDQVLILPTFYAQLLCV